MSLNEMFDRLTMRKYGISWKEFVRKSKPKYPKVKRDRLK